MEWLNLAASGFASFGYFAVFFLIILGSLGVPLPEESVLLLGGYLASVGFFKIYFLILFAILSTLAGDNLSYWLARKKGLDFMMKHGEIFTIKKSHLKKAELFFKKHGGKAVFFSRFIIGFRFFGPILAGVSNMPWKRFQFYNLLAILIWVPFVTFVGYILGTNIVAILAELANFGNIVFILLLLAVTIWLIRELVKED